MSKKTHGVILAVALLAYVPASTLSAADATLRQKNDPYFASAQRHQIGRAHV